MRIIICGSRNWTDRAQIHAEIDRLHTKYGDKLIIIHGVCETGADMIANDYCIEKDIRIIPFPARWRFHGNAAGPIRNQRMIDQGKPQGVVAFDMGGTGTASMISKANTAGLSVIRIAGVPADENLL